ncbi:MAG: hypothetical protein GTN40_05715 [Candidatus Aenigmarchaeota archaeon]|nr:hypothetical protein [Candidatus Aenigmarchaeota archaeon]
MDLRRILDIIKNSKDLKKCPACGSSYEVEEINFLGQFDSAYLIQFNCKVCNLPVIATLIVQEKKRKVKLISSSNRRVKVKKAIVTNEIIHLYQSLKSFDGDFETVFRKRKSKLDDTSG